MIERECVHYQVWDVTGRALATIWSTLSNTFIVQVKPGSGEKRTTPLLKQGSKQELKQVAQPLLVVNTD